MAETTGIEWADSTVNAWTGCEKISQACYACYAAISSPVRAMEVRIGEFLGVEPSADGKRKLKMWGPNGIRYEMLDWEQRLRALNRKAKKARETHLNVTASKPYVRPRVFINSLSDTFEDFTGDVYKLVDGDPSVVARSLDDVRQRLFAALEECTELDCLLLTKRPENVRRMAPSHWFRVPSMFLDVDGEMTPTGNGWPPWVWLGTTVESQEYADTRIPALLKIPAAIRFLSVEPLLGEVDLEPYIQFMSVATWRATRSEIHSVIVGGESSTKARPMHPDWVRKLRDQCVAAKVPFFFKQWGEWAPRAHGGYKLEDVALWNRKDADGWIYLRDLEPDRRENWDEHQFDDVRMYRVGKHNAGRLLDGRTWDEMPTTP